LEMLDAVRNAYNKRGARKIPVSLSEKDWRDLTQFLNGDIDNMTENDEIAIQMQMIIDAILKAIARRR